MIFADMVFDAINEGAVRANRNASITTTGGPGVNPRSRQKSGRKATSERPIRYPGASGAVVGTTAVGA